MKTPNNIDYALTARNHNPFISLLIPVFNEQETVNIFVTTVTNILDNAELKFELIFINDGSKDNTLVQLLKLQEEHNITIINLSRNFGKELALTAGIDFANGDVVIPIDVDMQDPPEVIIDFVSKWRDGYDMVFGIRADRTSDSRIKRVTAEFFYRVFNSMTHIDIPDNAGDFRLIDRQVVDTIRKLPERNRFMKGLFAWVGYPSVGVEYKRQPRTAGKTKWNYWHLWNFALDGITGFSSTPLRVWTYVGAVVSLFSFMYALVTMLKVLILGVDLPGYASLLTVILFLGGLQLLSLGIIGEYIGRIFIEVKDRPLYVVDHVYESNMSQQ